MSNAFDESPAFRARKERVIQLHGKESFQHALSDFTRHFQNFLDEQNERQTMAMNSADGMVQISPEEMVSMQVKGMWYEGMHGFMTRHYRRLAATDGGFSRLGSSFNKPAAPLSEAEIAKLDHIRDNIVSATSVRIMSEARKYRTSLYAFSDTIADQITMDIERQSNDPSLAGEIDPEMIREQADFISKTIRETGRVTADTLYDELLDIVMPHPPTPPANNNRPKNTPPKIG